MNITALASDRGPYNISEIDQNNKKFKIAQIFKMNFYLHPLWEYPEALVVKK